ncbi:hypothetical protein APS14_25650 [Pseudomonas thivervalensis]|nr:hypothetical protein APS14_25650 [Pseudomonas thivervalensis]
MHTTPLKLFKRILATHTGKALQTKTGYGPSIFEWIQTNGLHFRLDPMYLLMILTHIQLIAFQSLYRRNNTHWL